MTITEHPDPICSCRSAKAPHEHAHWSASEGVKLLAERISLEGRIVNCVFNGYNMDWSEPFMFEGEGVKKLNKINLDGWACQGPRAAK